VMKDFGGGTYLWWWPISGMNQYCTVETEARVEFERITKDDVDGGYKLVRYPAVTTMFGFCWNLFLLEFCAVVEIAKLIDLGCIKPNDGSVWL
jgi:hypothetical protein